jgi:aminopeptidase N
LSSLSSAFAEQRPLDAVLTLEHARERARRVSGVAYDVAIELDGHGRDYTGTVSASFVLADADTDLTMDFAGGTVATIEINGAASEPAYNGFFIVLPATALKSGANRVTIGFSHPYSTDGSGLYRFIDPEDGRAYVFTDFEPYNQNRLFPSFDQPNLKARFSSRVTVPRDWHVVSVVAPDSAVSVGDRKLWTFPASRPISTYVFALHAGQYHVWESEADGIPLRLFARESLACYVNPSEWFLITRQGFQFFQRYFDVPYPFQKYDQLIVPHFNFGAMENVAAVTFTERFVRRGVVTRHQRRGLASVLLHEMAHMWFGDLVTMEWWNGLWLNESFATFMATLAMTEATEFTDELESAYRSTVAAYRADERDTTHPIELPVPNTDTAFSNFDAITYEKGSATLKQLNHLVGPEAFRRGVSAYLKQYAHGNTSIEDFLGAIARESGRDLTGWARDWLNEAGANAIEVDMRCENGAIAGVTVLQTAPPRWPTLRTHRTQLGLYDFDGVSVTVRTLPVTYAGARTEVANLNGTPCPDLIYANHGDWDYVRVALDLRTVTALDGRLQLFDDALTRSMLWQGIWDLVLAARLLVTDFVDFALRNLSAEVDEGIVPQVLGALQSALRYLELLDADGEIGPRVEAFLWEQANSGAPGSDRQIQMFDAYVDTAASPAGLERLSALLGETIVPPSGIRLDADRRWNVLQSLSEADDSRTDELITAERARDTSDQGRLRSLAVEASRPNLAVKRAWLRRVLEDRDLTLADARAAAAALFPARQHRLHSELGAEILHGLEALNRNRMQGYFSSFVSAFLGSLGDARYLEQLDEAIAASRSLHPILQRGLRNSRFEVARCIAISSRHAERARR